MKKLLQLITICALTWGTSQAQIDGTTNIAPNFQGYDMNGNPHDFYADYLDQGMTIILDVSAHWCPPCWSYHQTHVLRDLHDQYGPSGTVTPNKVMVLMTDGDANSTFDDLNGLSSGTMGDWVTGTPYPIFGGETGLGANHGRDIANLYQITFFPTVFMIHPDRTVEVIGQVSSVSAIMNLVNGANPLSTTTNDVKVNSLSNVKSGCVGGASTADFYMKSLGSTPTTAATFEVLIDGSVVNTINWTGNVNQYELEKITAEAPSVSQGLHNMEVRVVDVNGIADEDAGNNTLDESFDVREHNIRDYKVIVRTDGNGSETSWRIEDGSGNVKYSKDDFQGGAYANNTTYTHEGIELLEAGCYSLIVEDTGGDGSEGFVTIKSEIGSTIVKAEIEGNGVTRNWESTYNDPNLSIDELKNGSFSIYPNPVRDIANVNLTLTNSSSVRVEIHNILGEKIYSKNYSTIDGDYNFTLNTENYTSGIYFMNIFSNDHKVTRKFIR